MRTLIEAVELDELAALHRRFGEAPLNTVELAVDTPFLDGANQKLTEGTRRAEICYILHRGSPEQGVLLHRKTFYPQDAYRLPTGGIHEGESVLQTLTREIFEETSFHVVVDGQLPVGKRVPVMIDAFVGTLRYQLHHASQQRTHWFATYHFLVSAPRGAVPTTIDPEEQVAGWRWQPVDELEAVAARLAGVGEQDAAWQDWGRFRALSHRFVAGTLTL